MVNCIFYLATAVKKNTFPIKYGKPVPSHPCPPSAKTHPTTSQYDLKKNLCKTIHRTIKKMYKKIPRTEEKIYTHSTRLFERGI